MLRSVRRRRGSRKGGFFRSDHFSLARTGIPAISLGGGTDLIDGGKEAGKKLRDDYLAHYYHQPTDEWSASWLLCEADPTYVWALGMQLRSFSYPRRIASG